MRDKKNLVEMICDMVKDIIPDVGGTILILAGKERLFFFSENFRERLNKGMAKDDFSWDGWWDFRSLIGEVFPEYAGCVYDNGLFLTPEEQLKKIGRAHV